MASEIYRCSEHADNVLIQMNELYNNGQFCDVTLIAGVDDTKISAHSFLLSACSEYFLKMFSKSWSESKDRKATLMEISGDTLHAIVQFLYTGAIELCVDTVESIFDAAHMMEIPKIVEACVDFLLGRLESSNCLGFFFFAELRNCSKLLAGATDYFCKNFMEVCKNDEFLKMDIKQLNKLIVRDDLNVISEEDVFNSVQTWVQHDATNRSKFFDELLSVIRLPLLNASFLISTVKPLCIATSNEKLYMEALEWNILPEARSVEKWTARKYINNSLIVVASLYIKNGFLNVYNPESNEWISWNSKPTYISTIYGITALNKSLLVFGSDSNGTIYVYILNLKKMIWTSKQLKSFTNSSNINIALIEKYLYVIDDSFIKRWNTNGLTNEWENFAELEQSLFKKSVAVLDNCLYFIGGSTLFDTYTTTVKSYVPSTQRWFTKAPMRCARENAAVGTFNGFLYVFGGCQENQQCVERYDKTKNEWTKVCNMNEKLSNMSCVLYENKFMLIGTDVNYKQLYTQFFDPARNIFEKQTQLIIQNSHQKVHSAVIPNIIPPNIFK